jgi:hypothetical protein
MGIVITVVTIIVLVVTGVVAVVCIDRDGRLFLRRELSLAPERESPRPMFRAGASPFR